MGFRAKRNDIDTVIVTKFTPIVLYISIMFS